MKKLLISFLLILSVVNYALTTHADPGDTINDTTNAVWLVTSKTISATPFMTFLLNKMDTMPEAFAASNTMNEFIPWMRIEIAANFTKFFPTITYQTIIGKIVGYEYNNPHILETYNSPQNEAVVTTTITCDEDGIEVIPRDVLLYKLVGGIFVEQAAGTFTTEWTFSGLSAGSYILVFDDLVSLPTILLVVA